MSSRRRTPEKKPVDVTVTRAKGRPMLTWVGKRPLDHVTAFLAQLVEKYEPAGADAAAKGDAWRDWPAKYPKGGLLFHGDNKEVLAHLLANGFRGKVDLIYIDPPFDSGADYVRKVTLRGPKGAAKIDGETYTLGEQIQYTDIWSNDNYLQFMYERLLLLKELLAEHGSLWLHCDWNKSHLLRLIVEEIFGPGSLINEISWQRISAHPDSTFFGHVHDTLFFVARQPDQVRFQMPYAPYSEEFIRRYFNRDDGDGRGPYWTGDLTAPGPRPGLDYDLKGRRPPSGRVWFTKKEKMEALDADGRIYWPGTGVPKLKRYLKEYPGVPATSLWTDIRSLAGLGAAAGERLNYPTQKPEDLLRRIITSSSAPGDLVLDCFIGSGTTAAVAQKLGRRWIGCDINKGAIQTTTKRLQGVIDEQREAAAPRRQGTLMDTEAAGEAKPAQTAFSVWRVNDYDLQIQHNEAVELACEHLGVERTKSDGFFDGTLGRDLVKIVPFNHPLSPLDLEAIRTELDARKDEDRGITVVSLGIEHGAREWLENWNRLRKGKNAANRISSIELRTDQKYGRFFQHQPAAAKVKMTRKGSTVTVEIQDVLSPTVFERLQQQAGVVQPQIDDWRAMVDSVMIDAAYDGEVFNVGLSDVPERKQDLVEGRYSIEVNTKPARIAVRITDVLGEEILVVREV